MLKALTRKSLGLLRLLAGIALLLAGLVLVYLTARLLAAANALIQGATLFFAIVLYVLCYSLLGSRSGRRT